MISCALRGTRTGMLLVGALFTAGPQPGRAAAPAPVPATQMAIVQIGNGGPEVLRYQSVPVLEPGAGEVLIKVVAAAVNPIEWRSRTGSGPPPQAGVSSSSAPAGGGMGPGAGIQPGAAAGLPGPAVGAIPGSDVSGIVVRLGAGVTSLKLGDAVFAKLVPASSGLNGAYAQYAIAPANQALPKPTGQTFAEAAGLGTVGMTAMRTLDHAKVQAGQRVFINGIGGGIGSSAAQIARARGAYVLGTASARHHEYLKSIGVNEVIDYQKVKFDQVIKQPVDVVIETVSTETANQALNILKPGGQLVSIAGAATAELCTAKGVTCARLGGAVGRSNPELLAEIRQLAEAGKYRLNVDAKFPLQEAGAAQDRNHNVGTTGKVVLIVDPALADRK